jgi:hypothetical protein
LFFPTIANVPMANVQCVIDSLINGFHQTKNTNGAKLIHAPLNLFHFCGKATLFKGQRTTTVGSVKHTCLRFYFFLKFKLAN